MDTDEQHEDALERISEYHRVALKAPRRLADAPVLDAIAALLGGSTGWQSSYLETIGQLVAHVRPDPGTPTAVTEYLDQLDAAVATR